MGLDDAIHAKPFIREEKKTRRWSSEHLLNDPRRTNLGENPEKNMTTIDSFDFQSAKPLIFQNRTFKWFVTQMYLDILR